MINEGFHGVGPDIPGCDYIEISDDDINIIGNNKKIQKMLGDGRISIIGNRLWYFDDDISTIELIDNLLNVNEMISFSNFLNEGKFYYDDMTDDLIVRIKKFINDWKEIVDAEKIDMYGEFIVRDNDDNNDNNRKKYKYTIKIEKE